MPWLRPPPSFRSRQPAAHLSFEDAERHGAVLEELVVEGAHVEGWSQRALGLVAQILDGELADLVAERLPRPRHVADDLALGVVARSAEVVDGLLPRPLSLVQPDVDHQACGAEQLGIQHVETSARCGIQAERYAQALRVERPALAE